MATFSANASGLITADHESECLPIRLGAGRVLYVYRLDAGASGGHTGNAGKVVCTWSEDDGVTWNASYTVVADDATYDTRNIAGGRLQSGRIVIFYRLYNATTSLHVSSWMTYSDDDGATWAAGSLLDMGSMVVWFGPLRMHPNGKYYTAAYNLSRVELWFSDDGVTWPNSSAYRKVVSTDGNISEPAIVHLNASSMVAVCRHEVYGSPGYWCYRSTDGGSTWGARTVLTNLSSYWMSAPWIMADYETSTLYLFGGERRYGTIPSASSLGDLLKVFTGSFTGVMASPNTAWTLAHSFVRPTPDADYSFYGYPYVSESADSSAICVFVERHPDAYNEDCELYYFTISGALLGDIRAAVFASTAAFTASGYSTSAGLTVVQNAYWRQYGSTITVRPPIGTRVTAVAYVVTPVAGSVIFDGVHSGRFALSTDGTTWASSLAVGAGVTAIYLSCIAETGDTTLTARVGIPS